jgi:hypothetical protein
MEPPHVAPEPPVWTLVRARCPPLPYLGRSRIFVVGRAVSAEHPIMTDSTTSDEAGAPLGAPDLLQVCRLLNEAGVRYLVYGGMACMLHGHERTTHDVDLYLESSDDNLRQALTSLSSWGEGWASELTPEDIRENVVVRIADVFILDLAAAVWKLEWAEVWKRRRIVTIEGVDIPFLSRRDLIQSKQTYRERDRWDVQALSLMSDPEPGRPGEA